MFSTAFSLRKIWWQAGFEAGPCSTLVSKTVSWLTPLCIEESVFDRHLWGECIRFEGHPHRSQYFQLEHLSDRFSVLCSRQYTCTRTTAVSKPSKCDRTSLHSLHCCRHSLYMAGDCASLGDLGILQLARQGLLDAMPYAAPTDAANMLLNDFAVGLSSNPVNRREV